MAFIGILIDSFPGHFFPTLGLARALRLRGHRVAYFGVPDVAGLVHEQEFEFIEIMADCLPRGSADRLRKQVGFDPENERLATAAQQKYFAPLVRGDVFDSIVESSRPDVMLVLSFLGIEALAVHYRYAIPIVLLSPFIRDQSRKQYLHSLVSRLLNLSSGVCEFVELANAAGERLETMAGLTERLMSWPEIALYPEAFDLPGERGASTAVYAGSGTDWPRTEEEVSLNVGDPSRTTIYCSLGSRPGDYGEVNTRLFRVVVEATAQRPEWQTILATGPDFRMEDLSCCPSNVIVRSWAPQLEILRRAHLMITHAGMGAVLECVSTCTPMVAFPMARDQHRNAQRIVHHGLGVAGDASTVRADGVERMVRSVLSDPVYEVNLMAMRERCRHSDPGAAVRLIENLIWQNGTGSPLAGDQLAERSSRGCLGGA